MKGIIKRGSLRCAAFAAACIIAVPYDGCLSSFSSVYAVSESVAEYKTWKQSDSRWGDIHLGKSGYNMRGSGCATTALAFLLVHAGNFKEVKFDPGIFCRLMSQYGGFTADGDILWGRVNRIASGFTFEKTEYLKKNLSYDERFAIIKKYYDQGKYLIIDVQNSGHWVAVDRIENGRIYSFDSAQNRDTDVFRQYDHLGNTCIKVFDSKFTSQVLPELEYNFETGKYIVTADVLNVRKQPSSSSERLGGLLRGTRVEVKGISGCWGMIIYDEAAAWICLEYLKEYTGPEEDTPLVTVISSEKTSPVTEKVTSVTPAPVTTAVMTTTTTVTTTTTAVTTTVTEPPAVTAEPETTAPVTVTGTLLTELSEINCRTISALNFRTGPGTDNDIICVIPNSTPVIVYGTNEDDRWGITEYNGRRGWICLDYVVLEESENSDPAVTETEKAAEPVTGSSETEASVTEGPQTEEPVTEAPVTGAPEQTEPETVSDTASVGEVIGSAAHGMAAIKLEPDASGIIRGDVDGNEFINVLDYIVLKGHFEGKSLTGTALDAADVNNDGALTISDLVALKRMFVNRNRK